MKNSWRAAVTRGWARALAAVCLFAMVSPAGGFEAVTVREYSVFATEGTGKVENPTGIARLADGTVAVADLSGRRVVLFRPSGAVVKITATPRGLAAAGEVLLVAEDARIRRFAADGRDLGVLVDDEVIDFSRLRGLAVDAYGNVYAADAGNDVVYVISPDGVPLTVIGEGMADEAELSSPAGVALDGAGNVFILDAGNDRVARYSTGGAYRGQLGPFDDAVAVAADAAGLVYVADADAGRVTRFDAAGKGYGAFGTSGRARGQFRALAAISIGDDGLLRVVDEKNRSLHVLGWPAPALPARTEVLPLSARAAGTVAGVTPIGFAPGGALVAVNRERRVVLLDRDGRESGRLPAGALDEPVAAIADREGRLSVVDRGAGEIKVYDRAGQELFSFGRGSRIIFFRGGSGKLVKPVGIAVSDQGVIAVADADKVELFGPDGTFMTAVGSPGDEPGQFEEPVGVAFAPDGAIFVADAENGTLLKYGPSGDYSGRTLAGVRPLALAADDAGHLYLLDAAGPRVIVLTTELETLLTIGADGAGPGGLAGAKRLVCLDDRLYVSRPDGMVSFDLDLPLPPPAGVTATPGVRGVALAWDPLPAEKIAGYAVTCNPAAQGGASVAAGTGGSNAATAAQGGASVAAGTGGSIAATAATRVETAAEEIGRLADETPYRFQVRAVNRFGHPGYASEEITVATLPLTVAAPPAPTIAYLPGLEGVTVAWPPLDAGYVAGYAVEGWLDDKFTRLLTTTTASCTSNLTHIRRWRVRALADTGREGPPSPETAHAAAEGLAALAAGSPALAAERLQTATGQEAENPHLWRALGEASEQLERFAEATAAYARVRRLAAGDTAAALGLARVALLKGEIDPARALVAEVARQLPADHADGEYCHVAGLLALATAEYDTAVRLLARAVAVSPTARHRAALAKAEEDQRRFGENRPRLEFAAVRLDPIFPALYKSYGTQPLGEVTVRNAGALPLERVRFSIFIRGAMDFPSDTVIPELVPGGSVSVPVRVELANSILDATEDDTRQAELRLTYYREGEPVEVRQTAAVRLYARTALVWDDPRKVAAFVTARAPVVAEFARPAAGIAPVTGISGNPPLHTAMLIRRTLIAAGLRYQQDPVNPYARRAADRVAVDHVQLPEETLRARAGDCDDLVVLLAALLENLGVRTMVGDLPGHLILLVDTELPPEAAAQVAAAGEWVEYGGTVWVPLETTRLEGGFAAAVTAGAARLAECRFIELAEAWRTYPPVTVRPTEWRAALPDAAAVRRDFRSEEEALRRRNADALAGADLRAPAGDTAAANRLGVVYARFGFYDEAERYLRRDGKSAAALNNLGNLYRLRGDRATADDYYRRALALDPGEAGIRENLERGER